MAGKPERIDHDPYASRRQPQQGERDERGSAQPGPRDPRPSTGPRPSAPRAPAGRDPADDLMQGGD